MSRKYTSIYGIHFTATFFFFFDTAVAAAVVMFLRFAWWLKAIYYDECVEIFHRLRFLMQSKCIFFSGKPNEIRFDSFYSFVKIQMDFALRLTNSLLLSFFSFVFVVVVAICSSFAGIFFFCWLLGFTKEW